MTYPGSHNHRARLDPEISLGAHRPRVSPALAALPVIANLHLHNIDSTLPLIDLNGLPFSTCLILRMNIHEIKGSTHCLWVFFLMPIKMHTRLVKQETLNVCSCITLGHLSDPPVRTSHPLRSPGLLLGRQGRGRGRRWHLRVDVAWPLPAQPRQGPAQDSGVSLPGEAPLCPLPPGQASAKETLWQQEGLGLSRTLCAQTLWGRDPKAVVVPMEPEHGAHVGVLTACPSSLPKGALDTRSRIPSSAPPTPGREARRCLLFICEGSCQELRQETAKENLTTRKGTEPSRKKATYPATATVVG